jgi:hypothetical protein
MQDNNGIVMILYVINLSITLYLKGSYIFDIYRIRIEKENI